MLEPARVDLLPAMPFVEPHDRIRRPGLKIRRRFVERQLAVYAKVHAREIHGRTGQLRPFLAADAFRIELTVEQVITAYAHAIDQVLMEKSPLRCRVSERQPDEFAEVKQFHLAPSEIRFAAECVEKIDLRVGCGRDHSRGPAGRDGGANEVRGLRGGGAAERGWVGEHANLHRSFYPRRRLAEATPHSWARQPRILTGLPCETFNTRRVPHSTHYDFNGRTAVVTGGARGIGFAIVQRLLASGANCSLWDNDPAALEAAARTLATPDRVQTAVVDITQEAQVNAATDAARTRFGTVDILVNNAGIAGVSKKLWECTPAEWRAVMELDLFAVFLCCRAIVPLMLSRPAGQQNSRIVNIASIAGKEGNPNASHYSAAKAGVIGLTKSLAKELATTGIRVNSVTPAVIETEILKQVSKEHVQYMLSKIPIGRPGTVDEVAAIVAWLCSDECSFTTGAVFDISGGRATY